MRRGGEEERCGRAKWRREVSHSTLHAHIVHTCKVVGHIQDDSVLCVAVPARYGHRPDEHGGGRAARRVGLVQPSPFYKKFLWIFESRKKNCCPRALPAPATPLLPHLPTHTMPEVSKLSVGVSAVTSGYALWEGQTSGLLA